MASGNSTDVTAILTWDSLRDTETRTVAFLAILTVSHTFALIFVGLRLFVRARLIRAFGTDDAVVALAALFALGGWIIFVIQSQHGFGRHWLSLDRLDQTIYAQMNFFYSIIATDISMCLLKVSIALNLLRISSGTRWCSRALWGLIFFVCLYSIAYIIVQLVFCQPISANWQWDSNARCLTYRWTEFQTIYGGINILLSISTDIALAILPVPLIWKTSLELRTRVYLVVILSLGYLAVGFGIVKAVYQFRPQNIFSDISYNLSVQFWGFIQINVGIIAACSVALRPLASAIVRYRSKNETSQPSKTENPSKVGNET